MINLIGYKESMGGIRRYTIPYEIGSEFQQKFWSREIVDDKTGEVVEEVSMAVIMNLHRLEKELPKQEQFEWVEAFNNARKR